MTKQVTYVCDVCGATSERPFKLHLSANYGKENIYADVCTTHCAIKFAEDAAEKAGIKTHKLPDPEDIQVTT